MSALLKNKLEAFKREIIYLDKENEFTKVVCELTYRNGYPEFTASGRYDGGCGQCVDRIDAATDNQQRLLDFWNTHHLKEIGEKEYLEIHEILDSIESETKEKYAEVDGSYSDRAIVLSKHLDIPLAMAEDMSVDFYIYNEEEATRAALERVDDTLRDVGFCGIPKSVILDNMDKSYLAEYFGIEKDEVSPSELEEYINQAGEHEVVEELENNSDLDINSLCEYVVDVDGRGNSLSSWDGEEYEYEVNGTTYYVYEN